MKIDTDILMEMADGDAEAENVVWSDAHLRALAMQCLRPSQFGRTLSPTALVHEVYLKLHSKRRWDSRNHFLGSVVAAMKSIIIDAARRKNAAKRGGGGSGTQFDEQIHIDEENAEQLLILDDALSRLRRSNPIGALIVEMKFFGGFTNKEVGEVIGASSSTVHQKWQFVRAQLSRDMLSGGPRSGGHA